MTSSKSRMRHLISIVAVTLNTMLGMSMIHAEAPAFQSRGGQLSPKMNARYDVLTVQAQAEKAERVIVRLRQAKPVKQALGTMDVQA
jgi:hypothetical protein